VGYKAVRGGGAIAPYPLYFDQSIVCPINSLFPISYFSPLSFIL